MLLMMPPNGPLENDEMLDADLVAAALYDNLRRYHELISIEYEKHRMSLKSPQRPRR